MFRIDRARHVVAALGVAAGLAIVGSGAAGSASEVRTVHIQDQCDDSFPVPCSNNGGVSFDTFLNVLFHAQDIGAWRFAPDVVRLQDGQAFQAVNFGGEDHTFTEVDEFGGGFVPELNALSGVGATVPECNLGALGPDDFLAPGDSTEAEVESPGTHHYQCCIHPWMRADVVVR